MSFDVMSKISQKSIASSFKPFEEYGAAVGGKKKKKSSLNTKYSKMKHNLPSSMEVGA